MPLPERRAVIRPHKFDGDESGSKPPLALYIEDAVILLAVAALFVLSVFFRHERWGQVGLAGVGVVMLVVLVLRLRRVHRAFTGRDEGE